MGNWNGIQSTAIIMIAMYLDRIYIRVTSNCCAVLCCSARSFLCVQQLLAPVASDDVYNVLPAPHFRLYACSMFVHVTQNIFDHLWCQIGANVQRPHMHSTIAGQDYEPLQMKTKFVRHPANRHVAPLSEPYKCHWHWTASRQWPGYSMEYDSHYRFNFGRCD